ncbi:lipase family protein [Luteipulveratus halotolerans]|uniref:Triacylglycerol lipase n=1 Tax=Luteipulveratus halotolerans TaxID=1631356 RepID=A0A0L6CKG5_9MICO|nr:lipase family protein [Luteipulveratus halotolerans]KNX38291.1 triacylglycerol lipase [Luteipulveratus halotolerans]
MLVRTTAAAVTSVAAALALIAAPAHAETSRGVEIPAFYDPPASVPAAPGTPIRGEPMPLAVNLPVVFPGTSTRLMYSTTDSSGKATAVTGALISSTKAWTGSGPRPVVAFAVGTIGQGDQCAPSYGLEHPVVLGVGDGTTTFGVNYDMAQMTFLLNKGYDVALTDYVGLGTTDRLHTYVNRADQAHALLDVVRAARQAPGSRVTAQTQVGLWGYSQGGGAVAAAAEEQPSYTADVNLVGSYAGAPPADLEATIKGVDGNLIAGVLGFTINGLRESYPQLKPVIDANLNAKGAAALDSISTACIGDAIGSYAFAKSTSWTKDGRSLSQIVAADPGVRAIVQEQRIGTRKPTSPVLVTSDLADGTVPHAQVRRLAVDWCGKGAPVTYKGLGLPPLPGDTDRLAVHHLAGAAEGLPSALSWLSDRFAGKPVTNSCGSLGA